MTRFLPRATAMAKLFIDGQAGTTGLKIYDQLKARGDIELLQIPEHARKDAKAKAAIFDAADIVVLCLPDAAAKEAVTLLGDTRGKILDASSAHRTAAGWVYGLPELDDEQAAHIRGATRVSNPGCYSTGFILAVRPLVAAGILPVDYPVTANAVSGYTGGGKELIERYRAHPTRQGHDDWSFRPYALALTHKHVPEMQKYTGLAHPPLFVPAVVNFAQGMLVSVPLAHRALKGAPTAADLHAVLARYYENSPLVRVLPLQDEGQLDRGFLSPLGLQDTNFVELMVYGNAAQSVVMARLDNLGKGASLAAIQNIELMLGLR